MLAPISSLLDLNPLTDRAERLVKAARAAGADAADAVALRSMSLGVEVRDGRVEESESSEGDDIGLRVLVGRRQAMVSTNEIADNSASLAERAVAMARATPEDKFAGLADQDMLAREFPIST
jgi:PmbA protein